MSLLSKEKRENMLMNYPDPSVEVSKNTLTPCPPLSHAKEGEISVHPGLGFPSLPGREGLGVSQNLRETCLSNEIFQCLSSMYVAKFLNQHADNTCKRIWKR